MGQDCLTPYYSEDGITIYHGDCREILPHLPKVDLVLTDPPYGVGIDYEGTYEDTPETLRQLLSDTLPLMHQVAEDKPILVFGAAPIRCLAVVIGFNPDRMLVWEPRFTLSCVISNGLAWRWHPIWCWNLPKKTEGLWKDALDDPCDGHNSWKHKGTKPLRLIKRLAIAFSVDSDLILDPFMGSGTTLVAAKQLGRRAIGIEIEEKYCEIAVERLAQGVLDLPQPA